MNYNLTFYNAIWIVFFCKLVLIAWNWWLFAILFLLCPMWGHLRTWYDEKQILKKRAEQHERDLSE